MKGHWRPLMLRTPGSSLSRNIVIAGYAVFLLVMPRIGSATIVAPQPGELEANCYPGSFLLNSDLCWGRVYSPAPTSRVFPPPNTGPVYWPRGPYVPYNPIWYNPGWPRVVYPYPAYPIYPTPQTPPMFFPSTNYPPPAPQQPMAR
jgi:hypothetical protein